MSDEPSGGSAAGLDEQTLRKVNDFVDDDLLSCFLWAAGENAVAQPGWESPSVIPLKGIPLPPNMPPLPPAPAASSGSGARSASGGASFLLDGPGSGGGVGARGGGRSGTRGAGGVGSGSIKLGEEGGAGSTASARGATAKDVAPLVGEDDDDDDDDLKEFKNIDDDDIDEIGKVSASGVPLTKEQKLAQRMQRKAESARVARLRKKEYVTGLEDQAGSPGVGVAASGVNPSTELSEEGMRQLSQLDALMRQPAADRLEVNATVERYVANKRAQQTSVNEFLDCIEDILSPAAPLQVAFNESGADELFVDASAAASAAASVAAAAAAPDAASGTKSENRGGGGGEKENAGASKRERDDEAANGEDAGTGDADVAADGSKRQRPESVGSQLMTTLQRELGLDAAQVDGLSAQKEAIRKDREIVGECMRQIRTLRARVADHIQCSQRTTDDLRRILEPAQVARFLLWVERNQRSMHRLNSIVATE